MSESIITEEQEEENSFTLEGWKLYAIIAIFISVSIFAFFATIKANLEVEKVNTSNEQLKASTGAKIDTILKNIEDNKNKWQEQDKIAKEAYIIANKAELTQQLINENTAKQKEELAKLNISVINQYMRVKCIKDTIHFKK